jgi:hypothetical protein
LILIDIGRKAYYPEDNAMCRSAHHQSGDMVNV